jgi:hypothetical protein
MNNNRYKYHQSEVETEAGIFSLNAAVSSGWTGQKFAANVHVDASRENNTLTMTLAVNETSQDRISRITKKASRINNSISALETIEKMRHALFDFPHMPQHIHNGVIENATILTLAGASRLVRLDQPIILPRLFDTMLMYEQVTDQDRYREIHKEIANVAFSNPSLVS